jgi:hypothetical protein
VYKQLEPWNPSEKYKPTRLHNVEWTVSNRRMVSNAHTELVTRATEESIEALT